MTTDELERKINSLENQLMVMKKLMGKLVFPLDFNSKAVIEQVSFQVLKALIFKGGLPIYTAARIDTPKQGEIYLTNIGGTQQICAYIDGTEYCATLT